MAKKKLSRFESPQVISMFPTLVWKTQFKIKFYETINKSIVKKLDEMTKSIPTISQPSFLKTDIMDGEVSAEYE